MRDDAIYCEHPNPEDPELAYIPYFVHVYLQTKDNRLKKRLICIICLLCAALIAALVIR